jgi:ribonuclease P protein component
VRAYEPLRRRGDFARVTRRGRRHAGAHLTCFVADGRRRNRVGITISASIGGAVVRNRLRRRIKAILDLSLRDAPPWRDIVFIARPGAGELRYPALADEVARVFPAAP